MAARSSFAKDRVVTHRRSPTQLSKLVFVSASRSAAVGGGCPARSLPLCDPTRRARPPPPNRCDAGGTALGAEGPSHARSCGGPARCKHLRGASAHAFKAIRVRGLGWGLRHVIRRLPDVSPSILGGAPQTVDTFRPTTLAKRGPSRPCAVLADHGYASPRLPTNTTTSASM